MTVPFAALKAPDGIKTGILERKNYFLTECGLKIFRNAGITAIVPAARPG
jgi:hypothetical protein